MTSAQIASHSRTIRAKAEALLAKRSMWARGEARVNGALIGVVLFSSSRNTKIVYMTMVTGAGCSCPASQKSASGRCCHRLACALACELAQNAEPQYDYSDEFGLVDIA